MHSVAANLADLVAVLEDDVTQAEATSSLERLREAVTRLRQERDLLREVYDRAYEFQGVLLPDGTLIDANQTALAFAGAARGAVLGKKFWEAPWWQTSEATRAALREAVAGAAAGEFRRYDVEVQGQGGQRITIDFSLTPVQDAAGTVTHLIAEGRNVSERVEAERQAAVSRAYLEALLEHVQDGIVACDAEGRLTIFNRAVREMHGLELSAVDPGDWAAHYSIYMADGVTPMPAQDVPLYRAWQGEAITTAELVIAPRAGQRRTVVASGAPLRSPEGELLGAVVAMHDITERKHIETRLRHDALHDRLTGLPNRALLHAALERAIARHQRHPHDPYAVMFLDLDNFKDINDGFGHLAGDRVLLEIAARLKRAVRKTDVVARLGGDEFAILLDAPCDEANVLRLAERLHRTLAKPVQVQGVQMPLTASIGATVGHARYTQIQEPLRDADTAMYRAKRQGRNRAALFDESMHAAVMRRIDLERGLREALDAGQFVLHYQPIVRLDGGVCAGFEALVRWQHPTRGLLGPGEFIEVAEATGVIRPLGAWVMREAARQLLAWQAQPGLAPLTLSVNVSGLQLQRHTAPEDHPLNLALPAGLQLEVTESSLIDSPDAEVALRTLAERGVHLALDDFGTGYASLAAVQRHPFRTLKIDRSFTRHLPHGERQRAIVASVVTLARGLNLRVIPEGIETAEQLACLRELGCEYAQGYLFARPLPADQALAYALAHRAPA